MGKSVALFAIACALLQLSLGVSSSSSSSDFTFAKENAFGYSYPARENKTISSVPCKNVQDCIEHTGSMGAYCGSPLAYGLIPWPMWLGNIFFFGMIISLTFALRSINAYVAFAGARHSTKQRVRSNPTVAAEGSTHTANPTVETSEVKFGTDQDVDNEAAIDEIMDVVDGIDNEKINEASETNANAEERRGKRKRPKKAAYARERRRTRAKRSDFTEQEWKERKRKMNAARVWRWRRAKGMKRRIRRRDFTEQEWKEREKNQIREQTAKYYDKRRKTKWKHTRPLLSKGCCMGDKCVFKSRITELYMRYYGELDHISPRRKKKRKKIGLGFDIGDFVKCNRITEKMLLQELKEVRPICRNCHSLHTRTQKKDISNARGKQKKNYEKVYVVKRKLSACKCCGIKCFKGNEVMFDMDHIPHYGKRKSISALCRDCDWEDVEDELQKCQMVCKNCHRIVTEIRDSKKWIAKGPAPTALKHHKWKIKMSMNVLSQIQRGNNDLHL